MSCVVAFTKFNRDIYANTLYILYILLPFLTLVLRDLFHELNIIVIIFLD